MTIDDRLLESTQDRARERGQTVGELIESSLRRELAADAPLGDGRRPSWSVDVPAGREIARLFTDDD